MPSMKAMADALKRAKAEKAAKEAAENSDQNKGGIQ